MNLHLPLPGSAIDVLLVQDSYHHHDARSRRGVARIDAPVAIGPDLWLGPVSGDLAERIRGASEPPGENFHPRRQHFFPYAFYSPSADMEFAFDTGRRLQTAVALSRLVHPTAAG